ncbi:MAG: helix-turn-helix domain-containing protein [Verrucomicrobia bacterium]|nr:helix-turn-helix domain-containing protein [Verrucomicrobiota bacterium]
MGRIAAEHFMDRGYRHYAWFSKQRIGVETERRDAYAAALAANGHHCHFLEWGTGRGRKKDTWANAKAWVSVELQKLPKPLALFVMDDSLAVDAVQACLDSGFRVPEDVAVLALGNLDLICECSPVVLSSVDEDLCEIAYRGARLLDRLMNGEPAPDQPEVVPHRGIVLRKSTQHFAITEPGLLKAAAFMAEHFARDIGLEDVARHAGLSLRAMHYAFKRELQRSPGQHLLRIRMDHAKEMLAKGDEKIGAIALACGFLTPRNFHRAFIKELGLPPGAYRASLAVVSSRP